MLIKEVILEGYFADLVIAVQDLLLKVTAKGVKEISTEEFRKLLAKQGFVTTIEELITTIDKSGHASSVDATKIVPANALPDAVATDGGEASAQTVADLAAGAADAGINSELPQ